LSISLKEKKKPTGILTRMIFTLEINLGRNDDNTEPSNP